MGIIPTSCLCQLRNRILVTLAFGSPLCERSFKIAEKKRLWARVGSQVRLYRLCYLSVIVDTCSSASASSTSLTLSKVSL
ncbi:hypothetical protein AtNW77_Chr5g0126651 [Arabidopsis thaliana]